MDKQLYGLNRLIWSTSKLWLNDNDDEVDDNNKVDNNNDGDDVNYNDNDNYNLW